MDQQQQQQQQHDPGIGSSGTNTMRDPNSQSSDTSTSSRAPDVPEQCEGQQEQQTQAQPPAPPEPVDVRETADWDPQEGSSSGIRHVPDRYMFEELPAETHRYEEPSLPGFRLHESPPDPRTRNPWRGEVYKQPYPSVKYSGKSPNESDTIVPDEFLRQVQPCGHELDLRERLRGTELLDPCPFCRLCQIEHYSMPMIEAAIAEEEDETSITQTYRYQRRAELIHERDAMSAVGGALWKWQIRVRSRKIREWVIGKKHEESVAKGKRPINQAIEDLTNMAQQNNSFRLKGGMDFEQEPQPPTSEDSSTGYDPTEAAEICARNGVRASLIKRSALRGYVHYAPWALARGPSAREIAWMCEDSDDDDEDDEEDGDDADDEDEQMAEDDVDETHHNATSSAQPPTDEGEGEGDFDEDMFEQEQIRLALEASMEDQDVALRQTLASSRQSHAHADDEDEQMQRAIANSQQLSIGGDSAMSDNSAPVNYAMTEQEATEEFNDGADFDDVDEFEGMDVEWD